MLTAHKLQVDCSLGEWGVIHACSIIGRLPESGLTLVCSFDALEQGLIISRKYNMQLILLPKEMLCRSNTPGDDGRETWGVNWAESWVWSYGA